MNTFTKVKLQNRTKLMILFFCYLAAYLMHVINLMAIYLINSGERVSMPMPAFHTTLKIAR